MGSILGSKVRCKLTGFTGVVTVTIKYLHGSDRLGVQSLELKDGKPADPYYADANQFDLVTE